MNNRFCLSSSKYESMIIKTEVETTVKEALVTDFKTGYYTDISWKYWQKPPITLAFNTDP
jgi:hypothetical protein